MYLAIVATKFQPVAVLFQWLVNEESPLHVLEWLFLPHIATKTAQTINEMFSYLGRKSRV